MTNSDSNDSHQANSNDAILVDLGSKTRKQIKRLRKGEGKLMKDVEECIGELKSSGQLGESAQPVIVIVREKAKPSVMWNPMSMMRW